MIPNKKTISFLKIVLIIWLVFSVLYVGRNEYNRFTQLVYGGGVKDGFQQAVAEILKKSQDCQPVPIFVGDQNEQLLNLKCLKNQSNAAPATPEKTTPAE